MGKLLTDFINLILYGNFWIAFGAVAMTFQTQYLFEIKPNFTPLIGLVFFATLFIYAAHRIIGLQKVKAFSDKGRFLVISKYKHHIFFYAFLGFVGSVICFFYVSLAVQLAIILPALISLGYVLPFLKGKKRLRDINTIKIFLVALVWAWVTVLLPLIESNIIDWQIIISVFLERACFIFAITLPFDIRDWKVDKHTGVKTIPVILGIKQSKKLAFFLLAVVQILSIWNYGHNSFGIQLGIFLALGITAYFISIAEEKEDDYFFTGLLDGTMIIHFLCIVFFNKIL